MIMVDVVTESPASMFPVSVENAKFVADKLVT